MNYVSKKDLPSSLHHDPSQLRQSEGHLLDLLVVSDIFGFLPGLIGILQKGLVFMLFLS